METRKIQQSGTTYYLYLPASWCREHKISTDSTVYLDKSSKGDLIIQTQKNENNLSSLKIELNDSSHEVINKIIIASYINPVKEFEIDLKESISPDRILEHKKLFGGLELVDFEDSKITCQTSLALSSPRVLLSAMIKKILNITKLMQKDSTHELIKKYEEEVDKSNLLIHKSIIAILMYRRESKLRHIELFYIGSISRILEQITDVLITLDGAQNLVIVVENMMKLLLTVTEKILLNDVINFINELQKLNKIQVNNLETYKEKRIYSSLGHISEILCDWVITDEVDNN